MSEVQQPSDPMNPTPSEVYLGIEAVLNKNNKVHDAYVAGRRDMDRETAAEVNTIFTKLIQDEKHRAVQRKAVEAKRLKRLAEGGE